MADKDRDDYDALDEMLPTTDELTGKSADSPLEAIQSDRTENSEENPDSKGIDAKEQSSAQKMMDALTDDDEERVSLSFGSVLGGDILTAAWIKHQILFIVLIVAMIIAYITNRYMSQQSMIKINSLKKELTEIKYESMTRSSQLLQRTRESKVIEFLRTTRDSALNVSPQPPYVIKINDEAK